MGGPPDATPDAEPVDDAPQMLGECPKFSDLLRCTIGATNLCAYEPSTGTLEPGTDCGDLCDRIGMRCRGSAVEKEQLCMSNDIRMTCELVGEGIICVCQR